MFAMTKGSMWMNGMREGEVKSKGEVGCGREGWLATLGRWIRE